MNDFVGFPAKLTFEWLRKVGQLYRPAQIRKLPSDNISIGIFENHFLVSEFG
jgi:hypothetical protein